MTSETQALLDLTKPCREQSDAELAATLDIQSCWIFLREVGEGTDVKEAMEEAARRLRTLSAQNEAMAEALRKIVATDPPHGHTPYAMKGGAYTMPYDPRPVAIARAALNHDQGEG